MKIVFFIDHLRHDGAQRYLSQIVIGLHERGHWIGIVVLNDSWDADLLALLQQHAEVLIIGTRALVFGYGLLTCLVWLYARSADCIVTTLFVSDLIGRPLARLVGVPRLMSAIQARNVDYSRLQLYLMKLTARLADMVVLNSEHLREFAITKEGVDSRKIVIIRNGIDTSKYNHSLAPYELQQRFQLNSGNKLVGTVGRLTYQKGLDILLHAFALINRHDIDLIFFGEGKERDNLLMLADQLGILQRVHFVGYQRDLPNILGSLDLYIHPSRFEGMPNAVLEAMAAGCPIIATAVDGNQELLMGGTGILVPPEDVSALAQAMHILLNDKQLARNMGRSAQIRAKQCFSIDTLIDKWETVIK